MDYEETAKQRIKYAQRNQGDIVIVAIQGAEQKSEQILKRGSPQNGYIKGVTLAVETINQQKGLIGRPLKLLIEQESPDFATAKSAIRHIVSNPKVSAVMGYQSTDLAIPVSAIYEKAQVLFFSSFTTKEELTSHNYHYTFRMLSDEKYMVNQIYNLVKALGYKKIAVLSTRADEHRKIALLFKEKNLGNPSLVFDHTFLNEMLDFRATLSDLKQKHVDAIFLSSDAITASRIIKQAREMGIYVPIIGSSNLDSKTFTASVGIAGNGTIVPTPYNLFSKNPINQAFVARYRHKYNQLPNVKAAQGYDSVMLFASKVDRARSTQPALLASTVRFSPPWTGVSGIYHFTKQGNLLGKPYFFKVLDKQQWQMLSAVNPKKH